MTTRCLEFEAYVVPIQNGDNMTMMRRAVTTIAAARADTMHDILLISSFAFWAVVLGLGPIVALHTLGGH